MIDGYNTQVDRMICLRVYMPNMPSRSLYTIKKNFLIAKRYFVSSYSNSPQCCLFFKEFWGRGVMCEFRATMKKHNFEPHGKQCA